MLSASTPALAAGSSKPLVYFENDFFGPGQTNLQALIPLVRSRNIKIVGIGVVTGDGWLKEESLHALRFLELAKRTDVPVFLGAEVPLVRSRAEMLNWEGLYGKIPWKGAWNSAVAGSDVFHPDRADYVRPLPEGMPSIKASSENAVSFLIKTVRAHPGQVTIVTAGPLTNIALAIRLAPDLPRLAKEIVIEGGKLDDQIPEVAQNADFSTDFNFLFDPEAAHIVLTSAWQRITMSADSTTKILVTKDDVATVSKSHSAIAQYYKQYSLVGLPYWDEITAAMAIDRKLISREMTAYMDVDLLRGPDYGRARIWNNDTAPHVGEQLVHIVLKIDAARFRREFISAAMQ